MQSKSIYFLLLTVLGFFSSAAFTAEQRRDDKTEPMYSKYWKKVDSLEQKGLYRMALTEVDQIFNRATKEANHNQVVKAVLYELKYNSYLEEDDYVLGIYRLEELIDEAPSPSKEILHSLLAEVYWGYYSANSWKYADRTAVAADLKDVRTWDLKRIALKIRDHYSLSLKNAGLTQKESVFDFPEIITTGTDSRNIRPTLFDFLAHRALDFFKSNTFNVAGPAETFVLDDDRYFGSNSTFLKLNVATHDSLNTRFLAMRVFWALTEFHMRTKQKEPLFQVELERLNFVREKGTQANKEKDYYAALQRMTEAYKNESYASEAWYQMATVHFSKGHQYNHKGDTTLRLEKKKAFEICEKTIAAYPDSFGSKQCEGLKASLLEKVLTINTPNAVPIGTDSKFLLNYKNLDQVYVKVVPFDNKRKNRHHGDKLYKELKRKKGVYSKTIELTNPEDYNEHSIELLMPELKNGLYYLVVSSDESFDYKKKGFACSPVWVTNITYQHRKIENQNNLLVSDRQSGEPLIGATVTVTYQKYNYVSRSYDEKSIGTFKTDQNGQVKFAGDGTYRDYMITLKHEGDVYMPWQGIYDYRRYDDTEKHVVTTFFTDRKLYRPGQTVYFKGICVEHDGKKRKLLKDRSTSVVFYDVNNQVVASQKVKTNRFGSFEGEFVAPHGVLTGQMRIANSEGSANFRVEEYKRPKFNVEMQPIEGEFKVNDSITAKGVAAAFAGNKIDGAEVKYRVVRSTYYNRWYRWSWYPNVEPKEIEAGALTTDENGEFEIRFKALPDLESNPKNLPLFNYTIYVDVTDINGETHSTQATVTVGYQSLQLGNNLSDAMNNMADFALEVSATNLSGQPVNTSGTVTVSRLKTPKKAYKNRLWPEPDMERWSATRFAALFPDDVYKDENDYHTWEVEKTVLTSSFNTADTNRVEWAGYKDLAPGVYCYEAEARDKNGVMVKDREYFTVFNPESNQSPNNEWLWIKQLQTTIEPGEVAQILLGTAAKDMEVHYDLEANGKLVSSKRILLSNEQKTLNFDVLEAYRGNFTVHISAVKENRYYGKSITFFVPYTNKELDVSFETFRNKLLPGADEEWTITIKNKYGKKEQAEMLATLYDASLDQLYTPNSFYWSIYQTFYGNKGWGNPSGLGYNAAANVNGDWNHYVAMPYHHYAYLNYHGWNRNYYYYGYFGRSSFGEIMEESEELMDQVTITSGKKDKRRFKKSANAEPAAVGGLDMSMNDNEMERGVAPAQTAGGEANKPDADQRGNNGDLGQVKARTNFNETAFFYPQLLSDKDGTVKIKFTIPESLTKWRFLGLAHTEDLKIGTVSEETVTQKDLMVVPNVPRFLREGDVITIAAKISNIAKEGLEGQAMLTLEDPFTGENLDASFKLEKATDKFVVEGGRSTTVSWQISVPYTVSAVKYKIVAKAGQYADGEENVLPILSNRMLVTESLPLPIRGKESKSFRFEKLIKSDKSKTLRHHRYTLEFTSNPAWYAIQAMPYMMEYPHECAEQTFTRYYSNAIASHVMNSNPKIKQIVEDWGENSPEAFLSNLQKNQELKAVMLEETPWVLSAKNEEESKRNLAVLLNMERMSRELDKALSKTIKNQSANGGWPWFPGMRESRYITQHIVTGLGHLDHLGIQSVREDRQVKQMISKGVKYLDGEIVKDFKNAKRWDKDYEKNQHISYNQIQYLYARSYFPYLGMDNSTKEAVTYYKNQAEQFWLKFNLYGQGMIAMAAHRFADQNKNEETLAVLATDIVKSLKDRSIQHEEFGMYWKDYKIGYYWYQAPIETQALMIEVFDEVTNDQEAVEELKIWLLKQKQTTNWKTTKQTSEAVYALLLKGTDLLASDEKVAISLGGKAIEYTNNPEPNDPYQVKAQAGTGYIKTAWTGDQVKPDLGKIEISKSDAGVAWGAAYWQYFEDLDKITFAETNLKLKKELFLVEITPNGEVLQPVGEGNALEVGEKVRVRIELRTDRNLEYVHMKDMRAAGFEPIDVLSYYRYQDGLGYYQSTKDVATHFFFDYVPKGTYVFEYDLRVQHEGDFSNGITTIQCMYAPEFTAHSEGIRVDVKP